MFRTTRAAAVAAAMIIGGCGDIVHPVAQAGLDDRIILTAILDPTAARHTVAASPTEDHAGSELHEVRATLYRRGGEGWASVVTAEPVDEERLDDEGELLCLLATINHLDVRNHVCMILDAAIETGGTYRVEVSARGRPTASGTTRVVGDFGVEEATLATGGDSPVLSFSWTQSLFAHRYLAGIGRWEDRVFCSSRCANWFVDLDSTSYAGPVPREHVDGAGPNPEVAVAALDRHLHAFLTSGHGWELFAVQPVMNVENGLGVVGSAVVRTLPATVRAGSGGS